MKFTPTRFGIFNNDGDLKFSSDIKEVYESIPETVFRIEMEDQEDYIGNSAPICGGCLWVRDLIRCP